MQGSDTQFRLRYRSSALDMESSRTSPMALFVSLGGMGFDTNLAGVSRPAARMGRTKVTVVWCSLCHVLQTQHPHQESLNDKSKLNRTVLDKGML